MFLIFKEIFICLYRTHVILTSYPSLENYLSPFMDAWQGGAQDQLQVRP